MDKKLRNKRLRVLARFLSRLHYKKLHMDSWTNECGTVCCAGGWACQIPSFVRDGLKLKKRYLLIYYSRFDFQQLEPYYRRNAGYDALTKFFGLDIYEARTIFDPNEYTGATESITPKTVVAKINKLILP